ncbi:MAG: hypothetical protein EXS37_03740 [Opitutus sp.]|nr:hypothetical protein [Opitutus sp.]
MQMGSPFARRAALRRRRVSPPNSGMASHCARWMQRRNQAMSDFLPQRRRPIHLPLRERPNQSAIVFLTACTDRRRSLFAKPEVMALLQEVWQQAQTWWVGRFVLMPDHLHLFCTPSGPDAPALSGWVKYWKAMAARRWPRPAEHPIWQQGFWDCQLRDGEHYAKRWEYVRNNPVRHGLVSDANEWPYQGEINVFRFHDG